MSHSCDDCGVIFDNSHAAQRHVKRGCPDVDSDDEAYTPKRFKSDDAVVWKSLDSDKLQNGYGEDTDDEDGDDSSFENLIQEVFHEFNDTYGDKCDDA